MNIIPVVELIRLEEDFDFGTFSVLKIQKQLFSYALEPPDLINARGKSSIPAQQYICQRHQSPRFGETFIVKDVPGRDLILFHWGNWKRNTEGCILLGSMILKLKNTAGGTASYRDKGVGNSGKTFKEFMQYMKPYNRFHLTIREFY